MPNVILLAKASKVFYAIFNGGWADQIDVGIVNAFKQFLQIFYLDKDKVTIENVGEVMNLDKKYDIKRYLDICVAILKRYLCSVKVC